MSSLFNKYAEYNKEAEDKKRADLVACLNATEDEEEEAEENSEEVL